MAYYVVVPKKERNRGGLQMCMTEPRGYAKLKAFFVEYGINQQEVADALGLTRSTFNSKLNRNHADFTLAEVRFLCRTYKLDANEFFLI